MLAVLSFLLFLVAGFDGHLGDVSAFDFACFAGAALALHLAYPLALPARR